MAKTVFNKEKVDDYVLDYHINDTIKTIIISKN